MNFDSELESRFAVGLRLVDAAEGPIMTRRHTCQASLKPDRTYVTEADRNAEILMRQMIRSACPDDCILGEEFPNSGDPTKDFCWTVDPIDGTADYWLGLGGFSTMLGLLWQGEPVAGIIRFHTLRETLAARRNHGCWHVDSGGEERRVHVVQRPINEATILVEGAHNAQPSTGALFALRTAANDLRFVCDAGQHAAVCWGRAQVAIDPVMKPWDIAPLVACVEEAGGKATTMGGIRENIIFGGSLVSSCGGQTHDGVIRILAAHPRP